MKRKFALLTAILLLSFCCACTSRDPSLPAPKTDEGKPAAVSDKKDQNPAKPTAAPASASDLLLPEPLSAEAEASLLGLKAALAESGDVCALAFIGYVSPDMSIAESVAVYGITEEFRCWDQYPFLREITPEQCAVDGNSELYCLVPGEKGCSVVIEEAEMEEGEPTDRTTERFRGNPDGPILFTADSNGWGSSNILLTVTGPSGREISFYPGLYSNLGTMVEAEGVLDFSVYEYTLPY